MADPIDTDAIRDSFRNGPAYVDRSLAICDEVDRLRERNLAYARDLAALRAENVRVLMERSEQTSMVHELRAENEALRAAANAATSLALAHSYRRMTSEHWRDLRDALVVAGHGPEADR